MNVSPSDSSGAKSRLAGLQVRLEAARGDVDRTLALGRELSQLAGEVTLACEAAFVCALDRQAA